MTETAIVILNWNGLEFLKKFLGNVITNSSGDSVDIVVADNGSTDDSVRWITENHRSVRIIRHDKNYGFAGGYNLALEQVSAKYFLLLNSDIEVSEGWLQPLTDHMNNNPVSAACQPKVLSYHRRDFFEHAGASGGYIDKYGFPFCRGRILNHLETDKGQYNDKVSVFWASGACMMVRAEAWKKCGGFDETFFAHMEEIDLCWRFHRSGYSVEIVPASVVYHVGGGTLSYTSPFKTYLNFRNSLYMLYKNLPQKGMARTMFIRRLLDGLAAAFFLVKGQSGSFRSVWRAHMDYYKNLPDLKARRKLVRQSGKPDYYAPVMNKSIIFEFYAKGRKTFSSLKINFIK